MRMRSTIQMRGVTRIVQSARQIRAGMTERQGKQSEACRAGRQTTMYRHDGDVGESGFRSRMR